MFGYVKDDERLPNNNTPFLDFEGKAKPENVRKINYYRELNQRAMQKRMQGIREGKTLQKVHVGPNAEGGLRMISELEIMQ